MAVRGRRVPRHADRDLRTSWRRRLGTALLGVVLFLTSGAAIGYHNLQSQVKVVDVNDLLGDDRPTQAAPAGPAKPGDSYAGRAVNILVLGTDTRSGSNNVDGSDGSEETAVARSDTAMVMHLSADRTRMDVVSIPRDTLVTIPSCVTQDGSSSWPQDRTMFNAAFATGAGSATDQAAVARGAACAIKTVEAMTGLYIDDYVVVDFSGLETMVNALGGVDVYVDEAIEDTDYTQLVLDVGCHHMDGATALGYARVRHGVGDGGDVSRIGRQQNLMSAMIRTATRKNILTSLDELYSFVSAGLGTLTTSPGIGSLTTLAGLVMSTSSIGLESIHFTTLPTAAPSWDLNRLVPTDEADEVWRALFSDTAIPSGSVSVQADGSTPAPAEDEGGTGDSAAGTAEDDAAPTAPGAATEPSATTNPAAQCGA